MALDRDHILAIDGFLTKHRVVQVAVAGTVFLCGLLVRLINLGYLALIGDEGTTYVAAQAILQKGIPVLDSGLWFHRALPYSYLVALSSALFSDLEFGLRFPSALFGALTVLCIFVFAYRLFGGSLLSASAISFAYALHPWAVELGRFGRMYSLFVLLYTTCILLFYLGFVLDIKSFRIWFSLTYVLAVMVHSPAIVLLALFGFRLLAKGWRSVLDRDVLNHLVVLIVASILLFFLPATLFYGNSVERPPDTFLAWGDANVAPKLGHIRLSLVIQLFYTLPATFLWMILSLVIFLFTLPLRRRNATTMAILFLAYCILVSLGSMLIWNYKINLRYIAHILPLMLVFCFFASAYLLTRFVPVLAQKKAIVVVAIGALTLICAYPLQSLAIVQREPGDRLYSPRRFGRMLPAAFFHYNYIDYYPDFASLAGLVEASQHSGDAVLVAGMPELFAPYSDLDIDYCVRLPRGSADSLAFYDGENIPRNIYTNTPYISSVQGILDIIASYGRVWLITTYSAGRSRETPPSISRWLDSQEQHVAFVSRDGRSKAFLFLSDDFPASPWSLARSLGDLQVSAMDQPLLWNWSGESWQSSLGASLVTGIGDMEDSLLIIHPAADDIPTKVRIRLPNYEISHIQLALRLAPEAADHSNGVRLSVDSLSADSESRQILDTVIQGPKWTCIDLDASEPIGHELQVVSDALGDASWDWLTARMLAFPVRSSWTLGEHDCSITAYTGQESLDWTPSGYHDASGRVLIGRSSLPVQGVTFPDQFHFHPDIESGVTYAEFEILSNPYSRLTTTYGLADGLADQSNGVHYKIEISSTEPDGFETLLSTDVHANVLEHKSIDLSPYLSRNLRVRLSSDALGDVAYDWLQVAVSLTEP
jgi:hypothetical protein